MRSSRSQTSSSVHESKLVLDLVARAEQVARDNAPEVVKELHIRIGALSHVEPTALRRHMEIFMEDPLLGDATVIVTKSTDEDAREARGVVLTSINVTGG